MHKTIISDVEITSDDTFVWLDSPRGLYARFGHFGYEAGRRKSCRLIYEVTTTLTTASDWRHFISACESLLQVAIPDSHKPKFLAAAEVA